MREQLDNVLRWAGLGSWEWSAETGSFDVSVGFLQKYGYSHEDLSPFTTEKWSGMIHPDDRERSVEAFTEMVTGVNTNYDVVYRVAAKDGRWITLNSRGGACRFAPNGTPIAFAGSIQDVTLLKSTEEAVNRRDRLLAASNEAARILLSASTSGMSFDLAIWRVLDLLGKASQVDRVYIWKNSYGADGRRYTTQVYEWSLGAEPQQGNELTVDIAFEEAIPTWEAILTKDQCINNLVRNMPQAEQEQLGPQGIISILVAPIMFENEFWGFIGFDDCTQERVWNDSEAGVLKAAGMMIAAAIIREKTEKSLEQERFFLEQLVETSPIGIAITQNSIVRRLNKRFTEMFGLRVGDSTLHRYISSADRYAMMEEINHKGIVDNVHIQMYGADNSVRDVLFTALKIDYEGKPAILAWLVDISALKRTEKALMVARDLAESGTRAKSEFLARMSHEIRTPMNAVIGMTYLCLQTEMTPKQHDYLQKIQTAATNLLGIIDDILDFSKIEAGKIELEQIPFQLTEVLTETVDLIEQKVKDKGIDLILRVNSDVCDHLLGDPLRLRQVLTNLVNNAVKFTEKGSITLYVDMAPTPPDSETVSLRFEIQDTGIGMTEEQIGGLFQSFSQADGSTTRKYGGTGLGLAISKNLVELMGGAIEVSSRPNHGTTFRFGATFTRLPHKQGETAVDLTKKRVLVVDDDSSAREIIKRIVMAFEMRVDAVDSGQGAISALAHAAHAGDPYEAVLLDWKMPRMDGLETVRRIRASKEIAELPQILMVSAYDRSECIRQSRGLGLAGFLVKPVTHVSLRDALCGVFDPARKASPQAEQFPDPVDNVKGAKILLVEDNKINQMVASELLRMLGVELSVANNGVEAVEAVRDRDFDLVLMDIQMPIMDGLTATREIRNLSKPEIDKLPILAMTANAMDVDYQRSLESGMNDHLTKPIDPIKLRNALQTWIVRK